VEELVEQFGLIPGSLGIIYNLRILSAKCRALAVFPFLIYIHDKTITVQHGALHM